MTTFYILLKIFNDKNKYITSSRHHRLDLQESQCVGSPLSGGLLWESIDRGKDTTSRKALVVGRESMTITATSRKVKGQRG